MSTVRLPTAGAYLLAFLVACYLGRLAVLPGTGLALFWPAAGVATLWLLRGTSRAEVLLDVVLLVVGTTGLFLALGLAPLACLLFGVANAVQALVVRQLSASVEGLPFTAPMPRRMGNGRDLADVAVAALIAAAAGSVAGTAAGYVTTGNWEAGTVVAWVVRNGCGIFVVVAATMAVMTTITSDRVRRGHRVALLVNAGRRHVVPELLAAVVVSLVVNGVVFGGDDRVPIVYLSIVTTAWFGFRFSPLVAGVHTGILGLIAVLCTLDERGAFGGVEDLTLRAVVVQVFVVVTAVIALMLSLSVAQREEQRRAAQRSAAESSARAELLQAITESMQDGLAVVDSRGELVVINPAVERLLGPLRADYAGDRGLYRADGEPLRAEDLPHRRALRGVATEPDDLLRIDPVTGSQLTLSVNAVPLEIGPGPDGYLAVLNVRDVTRERLQTRNLEAFAGVAAHDLQSPLSAVLSWAENLQDQLAERGEDVSAENDSVRHIQSAAGRMHELINDLLAFTLSQSRPLDLAEVSLDAVVDDVAGPLVAAGVADVEHERLGHVVGDRLLLRQLFTNLVGNAVKYVEPGTRPQVEITARRGPDHVEIAVSDNGIGIPEAERGRVFDNFYRASTSDGYPGTGLGLAICAGVVERHGGTIAAWSRPGRTGTSIVFRLPVEPPSDPGEPGPADDHVEPQREDRTTSADPPPRRTGSETAVSRPLGANSMAVAAPI